MIGAMLLIVLGAIGSVAGEKQDFLIWMTKWRQPVLDYFFYYATQLGETPGFVVAGLFLWWGSWRKMVFVPFLGLMSTVITYVLKKSFGHERPALLLDRIDWQGPLGVMDYQLLTGHSSFPSGHSMAAWALFAFVAAIVNRHWMTALCLFFAAAVSLSRVYLMAHFLQDVVAGAFFGTFLGYASYRLHTLWMSSLESKVPGPPPAATL